MATDLITVFQGGSLFAFPLALLAGVVAGLNPCCLPIYPAAAGCCSALRQKTARANVGIAAAFVLGNSLMTASLGVVTGLMGRAFRGLGPWPAYVIALLPIAFGLHLLGAVRIPLPATPSMREGRHGLMGAFVTGALIGLVITPCATPVLAGILAYVAMVGEPVRGGLLLFVYGIGVGVPVFLLGTVAGSLMTRLSHSSAHRWIDAATGVLLVGVGLYLIWIA